MKVFQKDKLADVMYVSESSAKLSIIHRKALSGSEEFFSRVMKRHWKLRAKFIKTRLSRICDQFSLRA